MATELPRSPAAGQRWLARLALGCAAAAALLLVAVAGWRSIGLVLLVAGHVVVIVVGVWLALAHRGPVRWLGVALAVAAQATTFVLEARAGLVWVVAVSTGLLALAGAAGTAAVRRGAGPRDTPGRAVPPPRRPFVIMNPKSGGGKVVRYGLRQKAEALGAEVALLEGPGPVDVADLARKAVQRGADLLGVAAGDGTQALVAAVAAGSGVPLLVISAGTRNHFALDLGLDREDPVRCLEALRDGVELRVDLGEVNGRPFVNNVSFGAYAAIVERPEYRGEKVRTTLNMLPDLLAGQRGPRLTARADGVTVESPQALLVSNNPYQVSDIAGLGRRPRIDGGVLGVIGVRAASAADAAWMLRGRRAPGLTVLTAGEVVVDADEPSIPAGVDGESVRLGTPVRCRVRPQALRVRVPRDRPGVPAMEAPRLPALVRLALPGGRPGRGAGP